MQNVVPWSIGLSDFFAHIHTHSSSSSSRRLATIFSFLKLLQYKLRRDAVGSTYDDEKYNDKCKGGNIVAIRSKQTPQCE